MSVIVCVCYYFPRGLFSVTSFLGVICECYHLGRGLFLFVTCFVGVVCVGYFYRELFVVVITVVESRLYLLLLLKGIRSVCY